MASQNVEKDCEANMNPVVDQEHGSKVLPNTLPDSEANSRESLVKQDDQDAIQCPALQEKAPAEDQSKLRDYEEGDIDLISLSFPRKLWTIVQSESFKSVNWTEEGDTIIIEVDLFQREVLQHKGAKKIFETDSLKGFIYQLNLHGFRKICPGAPEVSTGENRRVMMYRNLNFQRDKPGLLDYIWGKEDHGNLTHQAIYVPIPLRASQEPTSKKKMLPTRCSPQFYRKPEKEDDEESKKKKSKDQGPKGNQCFVFSNVWAMKTIPGCSIEYQSLGESSNPTREDNSGNVICMPQAASEIKGTEEMPSANSSGYPILSSMMFLYNNCCSVILSALSERPQNETREEEEQEGSSDYKYVICQSRKNGPRL